MTTMSATLPGVAESTSLDHFFHPSRFGPLPTYALHSLTRAHTVFTVLIGVRIVRMASSQCLDDNRFHTTPKYAIFRLCTSDSFSTFCANLFKCFPSTKPIEKFKFDFYLARIRENVFPAPGPFCPSAPLGYDHVAFINERNWEDAVNLLERAPQHYIIGVTLCTES